MDDSDGAVFCEGFCQRWGHNICVDVTDEEYGFMQELGEKSIWLCDPCRGR